MRRVILESPLAGETAEEIARNIDYAKKCMRDSRIRGEAPFASHLLYAQEGILDDTFPPEREFGIAAGFAWHDAAEAMVVYVDHGTSPGMQRGIRNATALGLLVEFRRLNP